MNASAALGTVLARLEGVQRVARGYVARCPVHADHRPSLAVTVGDDDRVLLLCRAGCETETILTTLHLTWGDLFAHPRPRTSSPSRPATVACELDVVRQSLLAKERRLAERRVHWADVMALADEACQLDRLLLRARQTVTDLGDVPAMWELAAKAAELEQMMMSAEAGVHEAVVGRSLW
jgi:hypothetical protein